MSNHDESKRTSIPNWLFEILKYSWPAVVSLVLMYIRLSILEANHAELKSTVVKMEAASLVLTERLADGASRVNIVEIKQTVLEKSNAEALGRIEKSLDELRGDVKLLQKK